MIDQSKLRVGDRVGHTSWGLEEYVCVEVNPDRFSLSIHGDPTSFPYYNEFFIAKVAVKEKSGFAKFIARVEHG